MNINKIPAELRERDHWVLWRSVTRGDRPTKVPYQPNCQEAKTNDPSTWSAFATVLAAAADFDGIGFVFSADDPFCGIDLDGCRNPQSGEIAPWAKRWIVAFGSYTEVSPSGEGVKVFVSGFNPRQSGKKRDLDECSFGSKAAGVEIYDKLRYFTVTGERLRGNIDISPSQSALALFCDEFWPSCDSTAAEKDHALGSVLARAEKYLQTIPGAVSGKSGHNRTFRAACRMVLGFGLSDGEALRLLTRWNATCQPAWTEKELRHKIDDARKQPGPIGYLRDVPPSQWSAIDLPEHQDPNLPQLTTLQNAANDYLDYIQTERPLVDLGIGDVDYAIGGGVAFGEMVVIAARPGHGKSMVALQCLDSATRAGMNALLISEEMSANAIGKRAIQFATETDEEHWTVCRQEVDSELAYHFDRRSDCFIAEGCRTADRVAEVVDYAVENHGVRVVAVDYAQLLQSKGRSRYEQITNTSVTLRQLANKHGIVLIVLAQLNREIESRDRFVPKMSDLRDSGQLEQDADVILFLVWPHRIDSNNHPKNYHVFVGKNRSRATNQHAVNCVFYPNRQMILHEQPGPDRLEVFDHWNDRD